MDNVGRVDWSAAEAGAEMDAAVHVLALMLPPIAWGEDTRCPVCGSGMRYCGGRSRCSECSECSEWRYSAYPDYSTDIAAAWQVVEGMKDAPGRKAKFRGFTVDSTAPEGRRGYSASFGYTMGGEHACAYGETAPLAICRAALLATATPATPPEPR